MAGVRKLDPATKADLGKDSNHGQAVFAVNKAEKQSVDDSDYANLGSAPAVPHPRHSR